MTEPSSPTGEQPDPDAAPGTASGDPLAGITADPAELPAAGATDAGTPDAVDVEPGEGRTSGS